MSKGNEAVRNRDEQISALWDDLSKGKQNPNHDSYSDAAAAHIDEAEARGAAEQRRKDGEGQEPVYQMKGSGTLWVTSRNKKEWEEECFQFENFNIPGFEKRILYTHPTNVAALEDRVRELEGALKEIIDMAGADCIHGLGPYIKIAQAALKREGGM